MKHIEGTSVYQSVRKGATPWYRMPRSSNARTLALLTSVLALIAGCAEEPAAPSASTPRLSQPSVEVVTGRTGLRFVLEGTGGVAPYRFAVPASTLPPGLTVEPEGIVHGVPRELGTFEVPVHLTDAHGAASTDDLTLTITRAVIRPGPTASFPRLVSDDPLTGGQLAWLNGSSPFALLQAWAAGEGLEGRADEAVLLVYRNSLQMISVPLYETQSGDQSWGAIFIAYPFLSAAEGFAYRVFPSEVTPMIRWYDGNGDSFTDHFNSEGDWVGTTFPKWEAASLLGDGLWERLKEWFSSDSPAEDLPWWYDFLCGLSCGAALTSGAPLAISGCIHCLGGYLAACIPVDCACSPAEPALLDH
jgi:hypothetical protein